MNVDSREYKVIIDEVMFADAPSGLDHLLKDIARDGKAVALAVKKVFKADDPQARFIRFLDTQNNTLLANELLLRQRVNPKDGKTEYTLKCRSEDRFLAAEKNVDARKRFKPQKKFEEDIGAPFVSRFSRSTTVSVDKKLAGERFPRTLADAAQMFPRLLEVRNGGRVCSPNTELIPVSDPAVFEEVFDGPEIRMRGKGDKIGPVAVILWSRGKKGRILIAELSFRHERIRRSLMGEIAPATKRFFEALQRQEWARPGAITKTQFMYRLGGR